LRSLLLITISNANKKDTVVRQFASVGSFSLRQPFRLASRPFMICFLAGIAAGCGAWAQGVTSTIRGTITDSSGAVVTGAVVTVTNVTKGWNRATVSGANGDYELPQLPPADTFSIAAELPGFKKEVRSGIVLQTGQQTRVDLALSAGQTSESVTVEAAASLVQSEDASVGTVVDERKIKELPLNGRQFWQLAQLVPNVFPPTQNSSLGFRGGFNVSGHREVENNYVLDGVDNSDQATMQPTSRPSVDGIQEFKVLTGVYNAEYGRYSGGQILVTTKSGSNDFHGTAYEFLRNSTMDARNFFAPQDVPAFRRNQFGASNGGRIVKNRTFYFATYEGLRLTNQVSGLASVPSSAVASGNFAGQAAIKDPATGAAFPNNVIPPSRINPISQALLKYFPAPTGPGLSNNYNFSLMGDAQEDQFSVRIDQLVTAKNNLFVSYQFGQRNTLYQANNVCGSRLTPGFGCTEPERTQGLAINDVHMFSPGLVNELRLGYNRIRTNRFNEDANFGNVGLELGIPQPGPDAPGNLGLPQVSITGFATIGAPSNLPQGRRNNTYNIIDGLSWIRGSHTFKFGGDYKHFIYNYSDSALATARGSFSFNGLYTGNAFADFLLGALRSTSVNPGDPTVRTYATSSGFYAQDEWKIGRRLTLSYGVRYELSFPQKERLNKIATFDPATGFVPVGTGELLNVDSAGRLVNVGTSTIDAAAWKTKYSNFAPRFGFAFRPFSDDKTVVRGGFGIFYNALFGTDAGVSSLFRGIPFRANQTFTNTATQTTATWTNPYPTGVGVAVGGYTPYGVAYDIATPYVQQWTFGLQREIARDLVLETTYLGSKGTHLPLSRNINQPTPGAGPIQSRRPYPQWGSISWMDSVGDSNYNSLSVRLERRYSQGISLLLAYTYSHSIDNGGGSGDGEGGIQDPRIIAANRGTSEFDITHRLVTSVVYNLPFGHGRAFGSTLPFLLRAPISGWEATGIATFQSGPPFTIFTSNDISNTGGANRPFSVGDPHLDNPTPTRWFNTAAYSIALPAGTFSYGNVGRNTLRADGTQNLDVGLFRNFALTERLGLQFRAEAFNVLNHANFGLPGGNISSSNFGQVSQTSTSSRQIQLGLKVIF
jgi:hypothetical protein